MARTTARFRCALKVRAEDGTWKYYSPLGLVDNPDAAAVLDDPAELAHLARVELPGGDDKGYKIVRVLWHERPLSNDGSFVDAYADADLRREATVDNRRVFYVLRKDGRYFEGAGKGYCDVLLHAHLFSACGEAYSFRRAGEEVVEVVADMRIENVVVAP